METGANVVESRALPWYAMLGNAAGNGRPSWTVSDSPLSCTRDSHAPICRRLATGDGMDGFLATLGTAGRGAGDEAISVSTILLL